MLRIDKEKYEELIKATDIALKKLSITHQPVERKHQPRPIPGINKPFANLKELFYKKGV